MTPIVFFTLNNARSSVAAWFDDAWTYRKAINIPTHTATENNVYVTVPEFDATDTTKFQVDCGDLRFTKTNGELLPYYVVDCDATATVHVQFDTLPAGETNYYMYYGNPGAPNGFSSSDFATAATGLGTQTFASEEISPAPVAYWKFDEGYGTVINNSSQNGYAGSFVGSPVWQSEDKCLSGKCLYFDGVDDVVDVTNGPLLGTGDFTISVWAKYNRDLAVGGAPQHVMSNSTYSCKLPAITQDYSNLRFYLKPGVATSPASPTIASILNGFHQFVIVREGNVFTSYIDGKYNGTVTDSTIDLTSSLWKFGADGACAGGTAPFKGFIDEAKIYGYARSAAQIKSDFASRGSTKGVSAQLSASNQNLDALSNGLVGYWKMDETSGNISDSSGNNNIGTVSGSDNYGSGKFGNGFRSGVSGTNLEKNPSVETNITGWSGWNNSGSATREQSNEQAKFGTYSFKQTVTSDGNQEGDSYGGDVVEGNTYTVSFWVNVPSVGTGESIPFYYRVWHSAGNYLVATITTITAATNGWVRYSMTQTIPNNGYTGNNIQLSFYTNKVGTVVYVDGVQIEQNSSVTPYFDGSFGTGHSWSGTAHNSTSIRTSSTATTTTNVNDTTGTIVYWFRSPSLDSSAQCPFGPSDGDANGGMLFGLKSTGIFLTHKYASGVTVTPQYSSTLSNNTWYNVAYTWDNANRQGNLYVDGALRQTVSYAQAITIGEYLQNIGTCTATGYTTFNGTVDDIRAYNRALSPSEVADLYNWAPGPIGEWNFEEGTGGSVNDTSGNGNPGTWGGTGSHWTNGKIGKAGSFNGSSDLVDVGNNLQPRTGSYTVSAWAKTSVLGYQDIFGNYWSVTPLSAFELRTNNNGKPYFLSYVSDSGTGVQGTTSMNDGQWHYWTGVIDSMAGKMRIYIDGVLEGETNYTATDINSGANTYQIGARESDLLWNGQIDQVRVYNYARSTKQIVEDMNAGHPLGGSPIGSQIGYWKMDEGYGVTANNTGSQGTTLNGTLRNSPTWTNDGKFNKGVALDGLNDHITVPNSSSIEYIGGDLTLSIWFKPDPSDDGGKIISRPWNGSGQYNYWITSNGGATPTPSFYLGGYTDYTLSFNQTITSNEWHYLAATVNSSKEVKVYIDGKLTNSGSHSITTWIPSVGNNHINLAIGTLYPYGDSWGGVTSYSAKGAIDEAKFYNAALTSDEIKLDYNHGSAMVLGTLSDNSSYEKGAANQEYCVPGDTSSCNAPIAEWKFDEHTGTSANDTSGNNLNFSNFVGQASWGQGKIGPALLTDGSGDAIYQDDTTGSPLDLTSNLTISFWIKLTSLNSNWKAILTKGDTGTDKDNNYECWINTTNALYCGIGNGTTSQLATYTSALEANKWYFISFVVDGSYLRMFVNGNPLTPASQTITPTANNSRLTINGLSSGTYSTPGLIDSLRIYNYARSAAQVAYDFNRGGPSGWWKLDECQGTTANDSSGNGGTGTIAIGSGGTNSSAGTCTGSSGQAWKDGVTGKYNSSLEFDGYDDNVSIPITATNGQDVKGPISYTVWFKRSDNGSWQTLVNKIDSCSSPLNGFILRFTGTDVLAFEGYKTSNVFNISYTSSTMSDGNWHYAVATWDGTSNANGVKIYVDNNMVSQGTSSADTFTSLVGYYQKIGSLSCNAHYFNGQIDDVRVYNYVLTPTQIKTIYNNGAVNYGPSTGIPQ